MHSIRMIMLFMASLSLLAEPVRADPIVPGITTDNVADRLAVAVRLTFPTAGDVQIEKGACLYREDWAVNYRCEYSHEGTPISVVAKDNPSGEVGYANVFAATDNPDQMAGLVDMTIAMARLFGVSTQDALELQGRLITAVMQIEAMTFTTETFRFELKTDTVGALYAVFTPA